MTRRTRVGACCAVPWNILTLGLELGFNFQLNFALQQCLPYTFEGYEMAEQPVTISVVVPGGKVATIPVPQGCLRYSWPAAIPAGTQVLFMMSDARGRIGGVTDFMRVGGSSDSSCLDDSALSSTIAPPSSTFLSATSIRSDSSSVATDTATSALPLFVDQS